MSNNDLDYSEQQEAELVNKLFNAEQRSAMNFVAKKAAEHVMARELPKHVTNCPIKVEITKQAFWIASRAAVGLVVIITLVAGGAWAAWQKLGVK